jgi:hypothetical protein
MTAIGKLLAVLTLVVGLGILTWSVGVYVQRPAWFDPPSESGVDRGNNPVTFAQMKAETESLTRAAGVASAAWGAHVKLLNERERYRAERKAGYAERLRWAQKGNPKDPVEPGNPKSPGKGFYEPFIDPSTKLHDLTLVAGIPKGKAVVGTDGNPLPGLDGLLDSLVGDVTAIQDLNAQILAGRKEYDKLSEQVASTEVRVIKMGVIRDSVTAELFFLSTFEVNVFETRATVFRREKQLRNSLKVLGINDP